MITENYIKMCEKVGEIQKLWRPKIGDWFSDINYEAGMIMLFPITKKEKLQFIKDKLWLPMQEQLWAMLPEIKDKIHVLFRFNKFLSGKYINDSAFVAFLVLSNMPKEDEEDFSITELLLAFVMKEKYNKIWDSKKWVKLDDRKNI